MMRSSQLSLHLFLQAITSRYDAHVVGQNYWQLFFGIDCKMLDQAIDRKLP